MVAYILVSPYIYLPDVPIEQIYMGGRLVTTNNFIQQLLETGQMSYAGFRDRNPSLHFYSAIVGVLTGHLEAQVVFLGTQMCAAMFLLAVYPAMIYRMCKYLLVAYCS